MPVSILRAAVEAAFREFVVADVPASGEHEPEKAEIRDALGRLLESTLSSVGAGIVPYRTQADRNADTGQDDGTLAFVQFDPTPANNGVSQWDDIAADWVSAAWYYNAVAAIVQPLVDDAEAAANAAAASAVTAAAAIDRYSVFLTPPAAGSRLSHVVDVEIFPGVTLADGSFAAITMPAQYCVREFARQAGTNRIQFRIEGFDGVATYTPLISESTLTNVFITDAGAGARRWPIYANGTNLAGIPDDTQVGWARVYLPAGAFGSYDGVADIPYAEGGLDPAKVQRDYTGALAAVDKRAATKVTSPAFELDTAPAYVKRVVRGVRLFGTKTGHDYGVAFLKTSATEFIARIRDLTSGELVAQVAIASPNYATIPNSIFIDPRAMGPGIGGETTGYTGIYGVLDIDRLAIVVAGATYTQTTFATCGIKRANVWSRARVIDEFWNNSAAAEQIVIAPGAASGAGAAAVVALYAEGAYAVPTDLSVRWCWRAMPDYPVEVVLPAGNFDFTNVYLPHNVWLRGQGRGRTFIRCADSSLVRPNIQGHQSNKIRDLTIYADAVPPAVFDTGLGHKAQYGLHRDQNNEFMTADLAGVVNYWAGLLCENVDFVGGPVQNFALAGMGTSSGTRDRFVNCFARSENPARTAPYFASHTCAASALPGRLEFDNCGCAPMPAVTALALQSEQAGVPACEVVVDGCPSFNQVGYSGAVAGGWVGRGDFTGPVYTSDGATYLEFSTTARLRNLTGGTIPGGTLCKSSGLSAVKAVDGDFVDCFPPFAVANGALGLFATNRQIDVRMVGMALGASGPVFVNNGVATTVAQPSGKSVGYARDGVLTLSTPY